MILLAAKFDAERRRFYQSEWQVSKKCINEEKSKFNSFGRFEEKERRGGEKLQERDSTQVVSLTSIKTKCHPSDLKL